MRSPPTYAELLAEVGGDRARLALRHEGQIRRKSERTNVTLSVVERVREAKRNLGDKWKALDPLFRRCLIAIIRRSRRNDLALYLTVAQGRNLDHVRGALRSPELPRRRDNQ